MRAASGLAGLPGYGLLSLLLGLVIGLIGPFGTFNDLDLGQRLAYWTIIALVNGAQLFVAITVLTQWRGGRWPAWSIGVVASALAGLPATAEVLVLELAFRRAVPVASWPMIYFYVLVLTSVITVPIAVWRDGRRQAAAGAPVAALPAELVPALPAGEALLKRLKPELRGEIWALEMEDHYLRVHTSRGHDLILHRMSDALAEVAGLEGRQVHRSYWVARAAVQSSERDGRRLLLVLKNGLKVPVARANVPELRKDGWI